MSGDQWVFLAVLAAIVVGSVVGAVACGLRQLDRLLVDDLDDDGGQW